MRYLIVGYGNIGHKRRNVLGKNCVATVDINPDIKADFIDYKKVPFEIYDVAVLTIPQQFKYEMTKYFLNKGKHVLVEKPLIINKSQRDQLLKLAQKNKVIWHTSYNHRFEPNLVKLKGFIKKGVLGKLYFGRLIYSFGNIKERIGTWRETEFSVLEEIAPHLLDFIISNFGYQGTDFTNFIAQKKESKIFDHWVFTTRDKKIILETSSIIWKNIFSIDLYGSLGSLHINGLNKWRGSDLIVRKRVFPAGIPKEKKFITEGPDQTWNEDFKYFEKQVRKNKTSLDLDSQISTALINLSKGASKTNNV